MKQTDCTYITAYGVKTSVLSAVLGAQDCIKKQIEICHIDTSQPG